MKILVLFSVHAKKSKKHFLQKSLENLSLSFFWVSFDGNPETLDLEKYSAQFSFDTILIAGGDGTFRRVLGVLHFQHRKESILFFPCGSANVFARMHRIPADLEYLRTPLTKKIGMGVWNDREIFLIAAIFGKAAKLSLDAHSLGKRFFGFFAYILGALFSLFHVFRKTILLESREIPVNSFLVLTPDFSTSVLPARFCQKSGLLLLFLKDRTFFGLLSVARDLFFSQKNPRHAELCHRESFLCEASFGNLFHLDGDFVPAAKGVKQHSFVFFPDRFSLLVPSS